MVKKKVTTAKNKKFKCKRCGRCCLHYGHELPATEKDIQLWEKEGRQDILDYVDTVEPMEGIVLAYDLWFIPNKDRQASRCPWLKKGRNKPYYTCLIYDVRPEVCRKYPKNKKHALRDKCSGYKWRTTK